ncbi:MAG: YbaK/EbsC family protein [bacterium]|nr:YbaK/EbsC family protein [bacterium]
MNLEQVLEQRGIGFEKHQHRVAYTAQRLASAEHVSGYDVAKPVVVKGGGQFTMCVLPACVRLDLARVAELLNLPNVQLASESEMNTLFPDCELGAEPPIGKLFGMVTIMDEKLREDEYVTMQAGTHTESVKLRRQDWESLCDPLVAPISQP